jgi:hypothetical protein
MKSLSFRENIWNLTRNVYLMSIFSITTSRYQRHILVWCLLNINTSHLIFVLVPECGEYDNFILDEIKRSISISVYYGWKRSIKNYRWRKIHHNIIFWLRFHTRHTRVPTQKLNEMCLCLINIILKYDVGTCLWLYWKLKKQLNFGGDLNTADLIVHRVRRVFFL